jgi:general secretion pathway protein F
MPIFEYKGLTKEGRNTKGIIDSENQRAARLKLKKDGVFVIEIKDKKKQSAEKKRGQSSGKNVDVKDLALMTRQFATLVKANIPLVDALTAVSEQVENPTLAEALADCKNMVNEGTPLGKAMAKYPNIFTNIYVSMVDAGEASGSLDNILLRLADFNESSSELRQKVSSAMTYPIIMLVVSLAVLIGLFVGLIPKLTVIFDSNPQLTLPWYTVAIIKFSDFLTNYWYILAGVIVAGYLIFNSWKKSESGEKQWDAIKLKLPILGPINQMVAVARFTRTLSTLLTGGVPMLNALDIVRNVVDNHVIAQAIDEARGNISEGENISGPLKKSGQFPPIVIHMVSIGEKTGDLENMLGRVADAYDFQVKNKLEGMTSIIGPIMTVVMGLVIGVIVLAVLVPMFELTNLSG